MAADEGAAEHPLNSDQTFAATIFIKVHHKCWEREISFVTLVELVNVESKIIWLHMKKALPEAHSIQAISDESVVENDLGPLSLVNKCNKCTNWVEWMDLWVGWGIEHLMVLKSPWKETPSKFKVLHSDQACWQKGTLEIGAQVTCSAHFKHQCNLCLDQNWN